MNAEQNVAPNLADPRIGSNHTELVLEPGRGPALSPIHTELVLTRVDLGTSFNHTELVLPRSEPGASLNHSEFPLRLR